jgi:hypothetical protein
MTRSHLTLLLALAIAVPALATAAAPYLSSTESPCFSIAGSAYRLTARADADYTVKIDDAAAQPDLVVQIVNDPSTADFVLVDGVESPANCADAHAIRTIRIDPQAREADLTIALAATPQPAGYRIYAQSAEFTVQDAAALFAVMWKSGRKRDLAAQ